MLNFFIFLAAKKVGQNFFFLAPLFCCCFCIRDPGWTKIRIRTYRIRNIDRNRRMKAIFCKCRSATPAEIFFGLDIFRAGSFVPLIYEKQIPLAI
jgi:hypothetical protein